MLGLGLAKLRRESGRPRAAGFEGTREGVNLSRLVLALLFLTLAEVVIVRKQIADVFQLLNDNGDMAPAQRQGHQRLLHPFAHVCQLLGGPFAFFQWQPLVEQMLGPFAFSSQALQPAQAAQKQFDPLVLFPRRVNLLLVVAENMAGFDLPLPELVTQRQHVP